MFFWSKSQSPAWLQGTDLMTLLYTRPSYQLFDDTAVGLGT
ncbi:hypothetical protein Psta_1918 [Pirellula staleyi DSM 6068]|uniref:Uncharacterized protein n=1 Tax=Pirellula staleyi (strain ATCC 27377 / DSM 6068 / ICPB 4128) TaxID=530564 RepID=D2QZV9_PIRSD|nr:hypothetical protein Psta_1918 [Pirellula staleyi DSM 6068]